MVGLGISTQHFKYNSSTRIGGGSGGGGEAGGGARGGDAGVWGRQIYGLSGKNQIFIKISF